MSESHNRLNVGNRHRSEATPPLQLKRGLIAYAVIVLAIGWSYGAWQIHTDRELTLAASDDQLTATATAFAMQVSAMIYDGVGAAEAGSNEINAQIIHLRDGQHLSAGQMSDIVARMLTGGDYVNELFVATPLLYVGANRQGTVITNTVRPAWRDGLFAGKAGATWIGHPVNVELGDAKALLPVAKRVTNINGEPAWAGALFGIESLDRIYRSLPMEHGGISLVSLDGIILARMPIEPNVNVSGTDVTGSEAFKKLRATDRELTLVEAPNPLTAHPRQFAARRIAGYPMVAVAGRDVNDTLLPWQNRTRSSIQLLAAATIALMILTVALYVTQQRRLAALQRSEERFQLAVAGSNDGIWDWELKVGRIYYSPRLKEHLGFTAADDFPPVPDTFWNLVHPDDRPPIEIALERHLRQHEPYDVEYRVRNRSGEYRWYRARAQAIWDANGKPQRIAGAISDIQERKLAEQSLLQAQDRELHAREEFAQHLLLAQEQERARLANELHDSVGQNLSLVKNRAVLLLQQSDLPAAAVQHAIALSDLTTEVIAEVRAVAQNLRPLHIEQLGLTDALETLLDKVGESSGIKIAQRLENVDDAIAGAVATHLYRIVQEAFNNVMKHAQSKHCRVLLEHDLHCVRLTIADDGIGFDPQASSNTHGLGLASIAQRARMMAAVWKVSSAIGAGTTIHIEIPIAETPLAERA